MKNSYLVTGGTGSFGNAFVDKLINSKKNISKLVFVILQKENHLSFCREKGKLQLQIWRNQNLP